MGVKKSISPNIGVTELAKLWETNPEIMVIDVRTAGEFESVHARGVKLQPLQTLDGERLAEALKSKDEAVYIFCQSGGRATQAAQQLHSAGLTQAIVVEGGTEAWIAADLPVERGPRKVMPLDRQMRTTAGGLIFLGALLALTVNPGFVIIPLFMGAGLVFSGLSGICGMTKFLARMPWNQASK